MLTPRQNNKHTSKIPAYQCGETKRLRIYVFIGIYKLLLIFMYFIGYNTA